MREPVVKVAKVGSDIGSKDIGDFLVYSKFNTPKIYMVAEGESEFSTYGQIHYYDIKHDLGYKPMCFGYFESPYKRMADEVATDPIWYMMNSKGLAYMNNSVLAGWQYNDSSSLDTNDSVTNLVVKHQHSIYDGSGGGTDYLPVKSKFKLFILADPENGAWF